VTASDEVRVQGSVASSLVPAKSSEKYKGIVKRFSERNGMGFIRCDRTREMYNVDVRVYRTEYQAANLSVGAAVSFHTLRGGRPNCPKGQPWATDVIKLSDEEAEAMLEAEAADGHGGRSPAGPVESPPGRGSALAAEAPMFQRPGPTGRLQASAPAFVPGTAYTTTMSCSKGLDANAPEFVPGVLRA